MAEQIIDGTGTGKRAKIDSTNHLATRSITEKESLESAVNGNQYLVTSGGMALTSAAASAVLYFKNAEDFPLVLNRIIFGAAVSTNGTTNVCAVAVTVNPTGLGSGSGNPAVGVNSNFGSSNTLTLTSSEIGQQGATVTGGTAGPTLFFPDKLTSTFDTDIVLPKGSSIAIAVTPPASNTSLVVAASINVHKLIED